MFDLLCLSCCVCHVVFVMLCVLLWCVYGVVLCAIRGCSCCVVLSLLVIVCCVHMSACVVVCCLFICVVCWC